MDYWVNVKNYTTEQSKCMYELQQKGTLCDARLVCKDGQVPVHQLILLSCQSHFFYKELKQKSFEMSDMEFDLNTFSMKCVNEMVAGLYTGQFILYQERVAELLELTTYLGLDAFSTCIRKVIDKNTDLAVINRQQKQLREKEQKHKSIKMKYKELHSDNQQKIQGSLQQMDVLEDKQGQCNEKASTRSKTLKPDEDTIGMEESFKIRSALNAVGNEILMKRNPIQVTVPLNVSGNYKIVEIKSPEKTKPTFPVVPVDIQKGLQNVPMNKSLSNTSAAKAPLHDSITTKYGGQSGKNTASLSMALVLSSNTCTISNVGGNQSKQTPFKTSVGKRTFSGFKSKNDAKNKNLEKNVPIKALVPVDVCAATDTDSNVSETKRKKKTQPDMLVLEPSNVPISSGVKSSIATDNKLIQKDSSVKVHVFAVPSTACKSINTKYNPIVAGHQTTITSGIQVSGTVVTSAVRASGPVAPAVPLSWPETPAVWTTGPLLNPKCSPSMSVHQTKTPLVQVSGSFVNSIVGAKTSLKQNTVGNLVPVSVPANNGKDFTVKIESDNGNNNLNSNSHDNGSSHNGKSQYISPKLKYPKETVVDTNEKPNQNDDQHLLNASIKTEDSITVASIKDEPDYQVCASPVSDGGDSGEPMGMGDKGEGTTTGREIKKEVVEESQVVNGNVVTMSCPTAVEQPSMVSLLGRQNILGVPVPQRRQNSSGVAVPQGPQNKLIALKHMGTNNIFIVNPNSAQNSGRGPSNVQNRLRGPNTIQVSRGTNTLQNLTGTNLNQQGNQPVRFLLVKMDKMGTSPAKVSTSTGIVTGRVTGTTPTSTGSVAGGTSTISIQPKAGLTCVTLTNDDNVLGINEGNQNAVKQKKKKLKCRICKKVLRDKFSLRSHIRSIHTGERPFQCEVCGRQFAATEYLRKHIAKHEGYEKVKCEVCGMGFSRKSDMKKHMKCHGAKTFLCDLCGKAFSTKFSLSQHTKIHTDDRPFLCTVCGNKFISERILSRHMLIHNKEEYPFSCSVCNKRFLREKDLTAHMPMHSAQVLKCRICQQEFNSKYDLKMHKKTHKQKPFKCTYCGKQFNKEKMYIVHRAKHTGEKLQFNCPICDKSFDSQIKMYGHMNTHRGKRHKCVICEKMFSRRENLRRHLATVHNCRDIEVPKLPLGRGKPKAQQTKVEQTVHIDGEVQEHVEIQQALDFLDLC